MCPFSGKFENSKKHQKILKTIFFLVPPRGMLLIKITVAAAAAAAVLKNMVPQRGMVYCSI